MQQKKSVGPRSNALNALSGPESGKGPAHRSTEITLATGQHQHILLDKLSPNLWRSIGDHLQRLYRRLCYSFTVSCCCCLPERMLPSPPESGYFCGSSACSRRFPAWFILSAVWIISILLSYPHSLYTKLEINRQYQEFMKPMIRCRFQPPDARTAIQLTLYTFFTQYILPIGITTYCYLHIGIFLWRRETIGALSEGRRVFLLQRKRRRVRMLCLVVLVFALTWLPLNVYIILKDFGVIFHENCKYQLGIGGQPRGN